MKGRSRPLRRLLRTVVPSVPVLSRRRPLMAVLDTVDSLLSVPFPEFRRLPPNRLRIRVGVGNRLLFNQVHFLTYGARTWSWIFSRGLADSRSKVVDIGCGCGRAAFALAGSGFEGRYLGVDVDREMIDWCRDHLASSHLAFEHADVFSSVYNPGGGRARYRLPVEDGTQDLVLSQSLFTHLLEDEVRHYVAEAARALRPGGVMIAGAFCLDDMRDAGALGGRWTFGHRVGAARVERPELPEAAVAYERDFLLETFREAGFAGVETLSGEGQSRFICRTKEAGGRT